MDTSLTYSVFCSPFLEFVYRYIECLTFVIFPMISDMMNVEVNLVLLGCKFLIDDCPDSGVPVICAT